LQTQIVELSAPETISHLNETFEALEEAAYQEYEAENIPRSRVYFLRYGHLRYQNQEHTTEIDLPGGTIATKQMDEILEHFHTSYEREYTYRLDAPVELVTYHLIAFAEVDKLKPEKLPSSDNKLEDAVKGHREVDYLDAGIHQATLYSGDILTAGMSFVGPAIIEEAETTIVIPPDMLCQVDDYGNYLILTAAEGETHE